MTDVLEPLRQLVQHCETHGIPLASVTVGEARAILNTYEWQSLDELGEPQPGVWPWDGSVCLVARHMGDPWGWVRGFGRWMSINKVISGWVCRGFTDPPGELGLGHPTHVRLPDPPPGGGDG